MSKFATLAFLMFAAFAASGCAGIQSRPGDYHVNGYTGDPIAATAVASRAYVDQYNAETYRRAVESGRAYPYAGGMGGDYWYHYRGFVPAPPPVVAPPPVSSGGPTSSAVVPPTGDALAEAREARRRADAALRMHARLRDRMAADEATDGGAPDAAPTP